MTRDKEGNGSAVIRFLPPVNGDELPWVRTYSFGFKGPTGRWYLNESPNTIGLPDPVAERNQADWASGDQAMQDEVRKRKRQTKYISNILVIKDPAHPENEGKIFLFKYGKKIHEMIASKAKPEFADDDPMYVWDLWDGANFKLRIKTVASYPNYDSSEFMSKSEVFGGDEDKLQELVDGCHKLSEFTEPGRFKSYETLKAEFDKAMNGSTVQPAAARRAADDNDEPTPPKEDAPKAARKVEAPKKVEKPAEGEDDMEYFRKMMEGLDE